MILRRLGNKSRIANKILNYFTKHDLYIELFFGGGGMFFNKPKAKYNICNDIDSEVFNLYMVAKNNIDELYNAIYQMPIHEDLWAYWETNKETEPVMQAVRFLFLSNFGHMGQAETLRFNGDNSKTILLENINKIDKKYLMFNL